MSNHVEVNNKTKKVFTWPNLVAKEFLAAILVTIFLLLYSYYVDAPLRELANPGEPENPAKAPWYFLGLQELVSYSAFMGGMGIPIIVIIGLMLIPYIDKDDKHFGVWFSGTEGKHIATQSALFSAIFTIGLLSFTVKWGWLRDWYVDIPQIAIVFVNPGTIIVLVYAFWSILTIRRTGSIRMAAIALFTSFLMGFIILTIMGTYFRGPNWDFYWSPSYWPAH